MKHEIVDVAFGIGGGGAAAGNGGPQAGGEGCGRAGGSGFQRRRCLASTLLGGTERRRRPEARISCGFASAARKPRRSRGWRRAEPRFKASISTPAARPYWSPDFGQYRIVHFATHSVLNNERPELSGVVLSLVDRAGRPQNGFLRLYDIYNLRLGSDLVVLSACQTALGGEITRRGSDRAHPWISVCRRAARGGDPVGDRRPHDGGADEAILRGNAGARRAAGSSASGRPDVDVENQGLGRAVLLGGFHP